jgi:OOP family OmpA-OmpF porin
LTATDDSAAARGRTPLAQQELDELCRILIGADRDRLREAIERLQQRGRFVDWQSKTLADAMQLALARDPEFAESMGTMISKGVHTTVERDSAAFGRALAPAMGPAIRNAVWMMLQGFVQSIEAVVDQQLSWRSVSWRIEAWRTGRSFAEIAFVHTLLFRVEHVFLLHRDNGLQLLHATRHGVLARQPDLIAAMLTAIQDFLRDAFDSPETDTATSFSINELSVLVENGNHAALAAVVRGQPRAEIRMQLREAIDRIETSMAAPLADFDGDTAPFEAVRPQVEACLTESARGRDEGRKQQRRRGSPVVRFALATMAVGLITWWVIASVAASAQRERFERFVAALQREPGFAITHSERSSEAVVVHGLRDPLARSFEAVAAEHSVSTLATGHLQPYHSLHEPFVARRVQQALLPPDGVTVALQDGRLTVTGAAPHAWLAQVRVVAAAIDGVAAVDVSACTDLDVLAFERAAAALHDLDPTLEQLRERDGDARAALATAVRRLSDLGHLADRRWALHADFVWWSADDQSASAQEARALVGELSRQLGRTVSLQGYRSDQSVPNATLRFSAATR